MELSGSKHGQAQIVTLDPSAQVVLEALELARAGCFAEVRDLFAPKLQSLVAPEALMQAWTMELQRQGEIPRSAHR